MHIDVFGHLGAAAGGFLGATFVALVAVVLNRVAVLFGIAAPIGSGNPAALAPIAFGPALGSHVPFTAGVPTIAYPARHGFVGSRRDIVGPPAGLTPAGSLLVGAVVGRITTLVAMALPASGPSEERRISILLPARSGRRLCSHRPPSP